MVTYKKQFSRLLPSFNVYSSHSSEEIGLSRLLDSRPPVAQAAITNSRSRIEIEEELLLTFPLMTDPASTIDLRVPRAPLTPVSTSVQNKPLPPLPPLPRRLAAQKYEHSTADHCQVGCRLNNKMKTSVRNLEISHPTFAQRDCSMLKHDIHTSAAPLTKSVSAMHFGTFFKSQQSTNRPMSQVGPEEANSNYHVRHPITYSDERPGRKMQQPKGKAVLDKFKEALNDGLITASHILSFQRRNVAMPISARPVRDHTELTESDVAIEQEVQRNLAVHKNLRDSPKVQKMFGSSPRHFDEMNQKLVDDSDIPYSGRNDVNFMRRHIVEPYFGSESAEDPFAETDGHGLGFQSSGGLELSGFDFSFPRTLHNTGSVRSDHSSIVLIESGEFDIQSMDEYDEDVTLQASLAGPHMYSNKLSGLRQHPNVLEYAEIPPWHDVKLNKNTEFKHGFSSLSSSPIIDPCSKPICSDSDIGIHPSTALERTSNASKINSSDTGLVAQASPFHKKSKTASLSQDHISRFLERLNTDIEIVDGSINAHVIENQWLAYDTQNCTSMLDVSLIDYDEPPSQMTLASSPSPQLSEMGNVTRRRYSTASPCITSESNLR